MKRITVSSCARAGFATVRVLLPFMLLCSPILRAADKAWDGGGPDFLWQTGVNWDGDIAPAAGDRLLFGGTLGLVNTNNFPNDTLFDGITITSPAGAFTLRGNSLALGGDIVNNQVVTLQSIHLPLALNATRSVSVVTDGFLILGGPISGLGAGLAKVGGGRLTLTASNTFGGPVTVNAGTLSVASDANLGAIPAAVEPGRIVLDGGALRPTSSFTLDPHRGLALGPPTGSGAGVFHVGDGITLTYRGIIADNGGTGGLTKIGFGALALSGANSYTGPTMIRNGTITLDFSHSNSPAANIISSSSALLLGGANAGLGDTSYAELVMNVSGTHANGQAFHGTVIDIGPARIQAGGAAEMALGALSHVPGGVVNIVRPSALGGTGQITTLTPNTHGILGGWASVGDGTVLNGLSVARDWASVDASGGIVAYAGYLDYATGQILADTATPATNLRYTSSSTGPVRVAAQNAGVTVDMNTLQLADPAGSIPASAAPDPNGRNVVIGVGNTLRLGRYGAIMRNVTSSSVTWEIDASDELLTQGQASLTAGGAPDTDGELIFNIFSASQSSGSLNVDANVTDNGAGKVTVVKAGRSSMKFRGHNTYSGGTYILQGRFQLAGSEQGGTANPDGWGTGPLHVFPGGQAFPSGISGATPFTNAIFMAGIGTDAENTGAIRLGNGSLYTGTITLIGDARLGGGGANNAAGGGATIAGKITGPFSLDIGSTANVGGGATVVILASSDNDWTGNTTILGRTGGTSGHGRLVLGTNDVIPNGFGKGNVIVGYPGVTASTSTLDLNGFNETINGLSSEGAANLAGLFVENNSVNPSTLTLGDNDQSAFFAGIIRDGTGAIGIQGLGPVNLRKIGGGIQTLTGANTYSGTTTVDGGTLALIGGGSISGSGQIAVNNSATLDVSGVTGGFSYPGALSTDNGTLIIKTTAPPGIGALTLNRSRVAVATLGVAPNVEVMSLSTGGDTNYIDILSVGAIESYPARFTVIKYSGSIGGQGFNFGLGAVPTPATKGYLSHNTADAAVELILTDGPKPLTWTASASGDWDIAASTNWLAFGTTPAAFLTLDSVRFGDGAASGIVNLTTTLQPGAILVSNSTLNYTFVGPGNLTGNAELVKDGAGTFIIANGGSNHFSGGITIHGGTLQVGTNGTTGNLPAGNLVNQGELVFSRSDDLIVGSAISGTGPLTKNGLGVLSLSGANTYEGPLRVVQGILRAGSGTALGADAGSTIISSGATLDVNGQTLNAEPISVSGAGVNGQGAIINTGPDNINALGNVTLTGNTTFGGSGRWDIRGGMARLSTDGSAFSIIKTGANQVSLVGASVDAALSNIDVQQGMLSVETTTTSLGNPSATLTVAAGATLQLYNTTTPWDKRFLLNGDGITATINNGSGDNTIAGPVTLNGDCVFNAGGSSLTLGGQIGGNGNLIKTGTSALFVNGNAANTGTTIIQGGVLYIEGAKTGGALIARGGTLGGLGAINSPVAIEAQGALSPGDPVVPVTYLNINQSLTLAGTVVMDVNKFGPDLASVSDRIVNVTALTFGGTLQLNIGGAGGEPLVLGDSVQLFQAASYVGAFNAIVPATPGDGLAWDMSGLAVNGTLKVTAAPEPKPEVESVIQSGTDLILRGSGGVPGGTFHMLTSTDAALTLASWTRLATDTFSWDGRFSVTNTIQLDTPQRFFILEVP
ncbi:MAG TPA: autotransporter-associated beta strand repeat-containing protein [Candidatus Paceibacterota bacterium]|nr:autotransporter-associated beta strand repeat-containing protein [Verrucomicrobiota bacterium]HOX03938.1 autotransporter-associated beta strand repeat-containing protein [Verrucomicrobiota bacterium]HRZ46843.1 autotransporter-associated beta strand repeat-containing protein [Candidatus Paceibacterota bacterium]